jgi:hypothetical protein
MWTGYFLGGSYSGRVPFSKKATRERTMGPKAGTFVLIPGAWIGGWVWEPVAEAVTK